MSGKDKINEFHVRQLGTGRITYEGMTLEPGQAMLVGPNGQKQIIEKPVASQLQRIEDGQNLLLQGQAALETQQERLLNKVAVLETIIREGFAGLAQRLEAIEAKQDQAQYELTNLQSEKGHRQNFDSALMQVSRQMQETRELMNKLDRRSRKRQPRKRK